nr:retrovirus-related Pol polyprotein from transposon TNT 1-94 [Tanacetum cinerariifolium]
MIEVARTMLADSKLPTTFWAATVNTTCYVQNRVLVVKPHFKTPYELFRGRTPAFSFMRLFGCHVTILNTLDHLEKFDGKLDEGFFVGYSTNSKAFMVYNTRTRKVEENLHINFLENKPIIADSDGDNKDNDGPCKESEIDNHGRPNAENSTKDVNTVGPNRVEVDISNISTTYHVPTTPNTRIHKDHSFDNVIGDIPSGVQTRSMTVTTDEQGFISVIYEEKTHEDLHTYLFACFLSQEEPKRITSALKDPAWVEAMQEELLQFHLQKVWTLVDLPRGKRAIGTKWVFRNKKDERGIVIRNKVSLVAQGFTQEEGIDYDEVFAPVARIEAIRLFLGYASFMGFLVYQMDLKSAFLYGRIEEEVYVCQPLGFKNLDYPDKVYKVEKALYGLHQAPRAWYETLTKYLLDNVFHRDKIDQTLFIKRQKEDILLVQVYVNDIIFSSTKKELCTEFEKLMHDKFQMSSMGELTFFLGLQMLIQPAPPMDKEKALLNDSDGDDVDVYFYRSMIRGSTTNMVEFDTGQEDDSQMVYSRLNTSYKRLYIAHALTQKVFRNIKRESRRFSRVETALFPTMLVNEQLSQGEGPTSPVGTQHTPTVIETSPQLQNISNTYRKTRTRTRRIGIRIPQSNVPSSVVDKAITKEMHDGLRRATTTASSLEAEQGSGNISKTQTKATPSGPSSPRTSSEGGPGCYFTMGDNPVQARPERLSNMPNEPPLEEGNISQSGEGGMQLLELMDVCTKLLDKVTTLENELKSTKAVYNKALITLTKRVKKLEKKLKHKRRRTVVDSSEDEEASLDKADSPKQGRMIKEIDEDENVNLVKSSKQGEEHKTAGHRMASDDTEVVDFSTASPQKDGDEITLAETLWISKRVQQKIKVKLLCKKYAQQVQAQWVSDEARIAQENLAQAEQWNDVQAHIQADEDLAQRMLEEERESLSIEERSRLLTEFIDQRKKMLAAKRAEEKRNKPPTQAQ